MEELKDITESRHGGNAESVAAHNSIIPTKAESRRRVYDAIYGSATAGMTTYEIAQAFGCEQGAVSGRITELLADGLIFDSGQRRETKSGNRARVVIAEVWRVQYITKLRSQMATQDDVQKWLDFIEPKGSKA